MATSSSSSSSSSLSVRSSSLSRNWEHDVFPSFHGPDVRKTFYSHILKEFRSKGINLFIDNEIKRGKSIGPELKQAIRGSKIAIVLLSKSYASSSWCLEELVEIMKKELGQTVITIFYEVDPTVVKKQTGDFGRVFKKTCRGKTKEKIETWRKALEDVSTITGYHTKNWDDEAAMIEIIANDISNMLNHLTPSHDFEHLIGMEAHMERMKLLLRLDVDEVRMIGIWGPPGIGKTTIARFLFDQVSSSFQNSAIMVNIKGSYPRPCLDEYNAQLQLQSQMLSQMINQKDIVIHHLGVAQGRLRDKKVFLVLDDVDRSAQLDALAKDVQWFGPRSRIIITTQDLKLLKAHGISHIYKVKFSSTDEALQMFCMYAFDQNTPKDGFAKLAREVTYLVGELPLGLKVMGSYFRGLSKQHWSMEVPRLRTNLNGEIESILKFSYDALCDEDKDLFLHIACLFNDQAMKRVEEYLVESFKNVRQRLHVLVEKSLISVDGKYIRMHNLLAQLGKEIVRKQSVLEPGRRQFLIDDKDICEVLNDYTTISRSVIGIDSRYELTITEKAFEGMSNLQFLRVGSDFGLPNIISSVGPLNYISPIIRLLDWSFFPMTCLPFITSLEFVVELRMVHSKLEKLWDGIKLLRHLKWMNLAYSKNLKELPNLSTATSLKELNLSRCSSLVELPYSIESATNLKNLYLSGCSSLVNLTSSIENATNLKILKLSGCSNLVELPSSIGNAINHKKINLSGCSSMVELPSSIGNATNLENLNLSGCSSLVKLPSSIGNATNIENLNLSGCSSLVKLPSSIGNATNLKNLDLNECSSLVELPFSIGNATNIQNLDLNGCSSLVELPSSIGNATNLRNLNLSKCSSLLKLCSSIGNATNIRNLNLSGCSSLVQLPSSLGNATNLQNLNLSYCSSLVELPSSIGNATNLENLNLSGCSSLVEFSSSIGNATNLNNLNFCGCSSMLELPSSLGNATSLQNLNLSYCSSLVELPSSIGNATNLENLNLSGCSSLVKLPSSIGNATNLKNLNLCGCSSMLELPSSLGNATNLQSLNLSYCSSLVELPLSIGNLHKLEDLCLLGCSKLKALPININMESLNLLDLIDCSSLKSFPEISTNIFYLNLIGTSIKEVPWSTRYWSHLHDLRMSYSENLKEFPYTLYSTTELHLSDTGILELGPWVKGFSRLNRLVLNGMQNLVSLSQLPDSLSYVDAENCESLEKLDCSFCNPLIRLNFINCFKLNQEARDLIIQTSTLAFVVLPGGEMPACFTYRAYGSSVTVKLNQKPLCRLTKFKACILFANKGEKKAHDFELVSVYCSITSKQKALTACIAYERSLYPITTEHLYIFDFEAAEVASIELVFKFELRRNTLQQIWEIKECGILPTLGASY